MKRSIIILIILLWCSTSFARIRFGLAASAHIGISPNGDYNEMVEEFSQSGGSGGGEDDSSDQRSGSMGSEFEFRIKFQEDLVMGIGIGMTSLPVGNPRKEDWLWGEIGSIDLQGNAISINITEYYILPLSRITDLLIGVGGEYHFANLHYKAKLTPSSEYIDDYFYAEGLGFKLKISMEFKITEQFMIQAGIIARILEISGFKNDKGQTLYSYWDNNGGRIWKPLYSMQEAYSGGGGGNDDGTQEASIGLSGIFLNLGIGYYF